MPRHLRHDKDPENPFSPKTAMQMKSTSAPMDGISATPP
jgi:hypothetical protein